MESWDNSSCWWRQGTSSLFCQDESWAVKSCSVHCPFPTFLIQDKYYFPFNSFGVCLSGGKKLTRIKAPCVSLDTLSAYFLGTYQFKCSLSHNFALRDFLPLTGNILETNHNFPAVYINFLIIILTNCVQHQSLLVVLPYCWRFLWSHHYQHCVAVFLRTGCW